MAVRTQEPEVLAAVVVGDAVDVVKVKNKGLVLPFADATDRASVLDPQSKQPADQASAVKRWSILDEDFFIGERALSCPVFDRWVCFTREAARPSRAQKMGHVELELSEATLHVPMASTVVWKTWRVEHGGHGSRDVYDGFELGHGEQADPRGKPTTPKCEVSSPVNRILEEMYRWFPAFGFSPSLRFTSVKEWEDSTSGPGSSAVYLDLRGTIMF